MASNGNVGHVLEDFYKGLVSILNSIRGRKKVKTVQQEEKPRFDLAVFFNEIRGKPLFPRGLSTDQVRGIEAKLNAFQEAGWSVSWAAYALATSYHETATRMQPVREGLSLSDAWRKRNLRYYPWYGRGDVQLTWEDNYVKMDKELGLGGKLVDNPDLALDPDISAKILVAGMSKGLFSKDKQGVPHSLGRYLPTDDAEATRNQFIPSRRIINLMDRAEKIADIAVKFQSALVKAGYRR